MWKSPRPKRRHEANSEKAISKVSRNIFATNYEKRKIDLLLSLEGFSVPVASAILTITDPKNYGIIDIRTWKVLYEYKAVKVRPTGTNFSFKNWYNYLMQLRYFAAKYGVTARDIERTLFDYHKRTSEGVLYKR